MGSVDVNNSSFDLFKFRVESLIDNSSTDFDLFINLDEHLILYSGIGYRWHKQELNDLLKAGFAFLFCRKRDATKAKMYASLSRLPQIESTQSPRERVRSIEDIGAKFTQCIYEGELTASCVQMASELTSSLVSCILEEPGCVKFLSALADHDYYTYFHSVRVAAYATAIAIQIGLRAPRVLEDLALGAIFHDVGKKDVPIKIINKSGPLTEIEWQQMRAHPINGYDRLVGCTSSHIALDVILHHHEKRNGRGYPHGLDQRSLLPEVQIVTLADVFDALTSNRAYQTPRSRFDSLEFIKSRLLGGEVCPEAFKSLVMCLAN